MTSSRYVVTEAVCGGLECHGASYQSAKCNEDCCPVDCEWNGWREWGECSKSCGAGGSRNRYRSLAWGESCGGEPCQGSSRERESCNEDVCCPVDCVMSEWSEFSECDVTCGGGERKRSRKVIVASQCGGSPCLPTLDEYEACNWEVCVIDCEWGEWTDWSVCTEECGGGKQERERVVVKMAENGGKSCDGEQVEERFVF